MGVKPKAIVKKSAAAPKAKGAGPGGGTTPPSSTYRTWDSGEIQNQIGSKNKDKKKLVMQLYCEVTKLNATNYNWFVGFRLKAEDKDLTGSGWHPANALASFSYNFKYKQGNAAAVIKTGTKPVAGKALDDGVLFAGTAGAANLLPVLQTKQATGVRSGGLSGITITI